MKNTFKKLIIVGIIMLLALSGVSCSSNSNKAKDTLSKDKLVVGFDDTFVPMGYKDDKGEIVGFDVDLAKEVSKRIGKELVFQSINWSMKETELNSGNIDMIWNGYSISDERQQKVLFSRPYLDNRQIIITLASSTINNKADLAGKKVSAQNESTAVDAINREPEVLKSFKDGKIFTFDTNNEALMDLEAGRVDAVVADEILAKYYIDKKGSDKYKILSEDFGSETYGVGMRKADTALKQKIDDAFEAMVKDGTAKSISEKWFGDDIFKK